MLSTTYSKFTELQFRLPVADAEAQRDCPKEIIVAVSADGRYTVNKSRSTAAASRPSRPRWPPPPAARKDIVVIISADATRDAPVRDQRDGSGAPRRPDADHLRDAVGRAGRDDEPWRRCSSAWLQTRRRWRGCCGRCRWSIGALTALATLAVSPRACCATERVGVPVVVVGNVIVGGAGKTPVVIAHRAAPARRAAQGRRRLARLRPRRPTTAARCSTTATRATSATSRC